MKIMVFDVPAEDGGALSILHEFYERFLEDEQNHHIFVVSKPVLKSEKNVTVLRFPWIKKSWLHRLYFDHFVAPKLVLKYQADEVLSLQNIVVPRVDVFQTVYVHNALPFSEYRFSFFEDKLLWVYQNILSRNIYKSIKVADKVIVQTKWMKKVCLDKLFIKEDKIDVLLPKINIKAKRFFESTKESHSTFFYPASGVSFKNHKAILNACLSLQADKCIDYRVIFTLVGTENERVKSLFEMVQRHELPVLFVGPLSKEDVFEYYTKSVLLFPSYIETVGLPMLEAKLHNTPVLASDCAFSHEIMEGYDRADFFRPFDVLQLKALMYKMICGGYE